MRKLFGYIAGPDIDNRIKWIVDSLIEIFLACNVEEILHNYGKGTGKWLKDRKGRKLEYEDTALPKNYWGLSETDRLMKAIDKIDFE